MHIGLYTPAWPLEGAANGIVTYVHVMREALQAEGHAVSVVAPGLVQTADGRMAATPWRRPLKDRIIGAIGRSRTGPGQHLFDAGHHIARSFAAIDRRQRLDIVEMEESFGWSGQVQDRLGIPVVTRLHGPHFLGQCDVEAGEAAALSARRNAAEGQAIRAARCLSAPSATLLAATVAHYGSTPRLARFIPNPVVLRADTPDWRLGACDPDMVLCVGRFDRRKGADVAIAAFLRVLERRPTARLVMVGPEPGLQLGSEVFDFASYCERHVPLQWRSQIVHLGRLAPAEIAALRQRAFVTIVCSRFENFPYAVAEAIAVGCPVIATRSFGNAEMIEDGETGLLVDVEDAAGLAEAIVKAFAEPDRMATLGAAAKRHCERSYSPSVILAQTLALYREALA